MSSIAEQFARGVFVKCRCKKCNHDKPNYKVVSQIPHKDGIKLKCIWCGDISVKD